MSNLPVSLYLKHRLVASPLSDPFLKARRAFHQWRTRKDPELALLRAEDHMIERFLVRTLARDSVCVDIGAHIGSMTRVFRRVAPEGRHVAVEAVPQKARWLRKSFSDVEVYNTALSDTEGEVVFYENMDRPGCSSLGRRVGANREFRIGCTTLDTLMDGVPRIDLVKIDVEGFELEVVRGGRKIVDRLSPVLLFEAGPVSDTDIDNGKYTELFDLLTRDLGDRIHPVFGALANAAPLDQSSFAFCRTYPYLAFNYVARKDPT